MEVVLAITFTLMFTGVIAMLASSHDTDDNLFAFGGCTFTISLILFASCGLVQFGRHIEHQFPSVKPENVAKNNADKEVVPPKAESAD